LPRKNAEFTLAPENKQKLKGLLEKTVEFTKLDKILGEQLDIEEGENQIDIVSQVYMNKIFKSLDYHFLSKTDLNAVDKPEWMVSFIEEAFTANIVFLLTLGLEERVLKVLVKSFLEAFYWKLSQRFQQDSSFFLEHEFLFTNFLVCLNEHAYKMMSFLEEKGIELEDPEIYNLNNIYQGRREYLDKMISGELKEFEDLIFNVKSSFGGYEG